MPLYSLLFIYADETIGESMQIECSTDEQAMAIASQEAGGHLAIQVWGRTTSWLGWQFGCRRAAVTPDLHSALHYFNGRRPLRGAVRCFGSPRTGQL
jgi:hypothetical protein